MMVSEGGRGSLGGGSEATHPPSSRWKRGVVVRRCDKDVWVEKLSLSMAFRHGFRAIGQEGSDPAVRPSQQHFSG